MTQECHSDCLIIRVKTIFQHGQLMNISQKTCYKYIFLSQNELMLHNNIYWFYGASVDGSVWYTNLKVHCACNLSTCSSDTSECNQNKELINGYTPSWVPLKGFKIRFDIIAENTV